MIESAVHDLIQGISTFWADKSLSRFGGQIFETFLVVCTFALIANDQRSPTRTVIANLTMVITYAPPKSKERGEDGRNTLTGWVDSDFVADPDTRKSMTGYLFSLNGGAVSWRSSRQGGVTLSSAEAEFVAASQAAC